jgi:cytosine/adenosine deaminase-related metal-dependent hydrolase
MYHYAANFIFDGLRLRRNAYVSIDDNGIVCYVSSDEEALTERPSMSFYNGIICPGFVNAHCHLELSDITSNFEGNPGLSGFIKHILLNRSREKKRIKIAQTDRQMFLNGISLVGDISNTDSTIKIKKVSKIKYHTFIEISGINKDNAEQCVVDGENIRDKFIGSDLTADLTIHSFYSVSKTLIDNFINRNKAQQISIHFFESPEETELFTNSTGDLYNLMKSIDSNYEPLFNSNHELIGIIEAFSSENIILVHNLMLETPLITKDKKLYYCFCPSSNIRLSDQLPQSTFVFKVKDDFVVGTDSLASNDKLCILEELKILASKFDFLTLSDLLKAATCNGAKALNSLDEFGSFEIGKSPGVVLIENLDLRNQKLTNDTVVRRLV